MNADQAARARERRGLSLVYPALWATENRTFNGEAYTFEGREFLIAIHNDNREHVVLMKGNQIGGTLAAENIACCEIDGGNPVMWVFPTDKIAKRHVASRFDPMLKASPKVAALFDDTNSLEVKTSGEAAIYFEGSNSKAGAHSVPVVRLIVDELDRCDEDRLEEFEKRMSGQVSPLRFDLSTPTLPGRGIDEAFENSDRKFWFLDCPDAACNLSGPLVWVEDPPDGWPDPVAVVRWRSYPRNTFGDVEELELQARGAWLECRECGHVWTEEERREASSAGEWIATNPERETSGYWINQLCSPVRPPSRIVGDFLRAVKSEKAKSLQTFFNGDLGLPYLGKGDAITRGQVEELIVPGSVRSLGETASLALGVDIGSAKHGALGGRVGETLVAEFFTVKTFGDIRDLIRARGVASCVVDALPALDEAERLCAEFPGLVFRCFTKDGQRIPDVWDATHGIVDISRVSLTEFVHHRIRGRSLRILRNETATTAALHLTRVAIVETTNAAGDLVRVAKKLSRVDHFHWATVYLELAARRLRDGGGDVSFESDPSFKDERSSWVDAGFERGLDSALGIGDLGDVAPPLGSIVGSDNPFQDW